MAELPIGLLDPVAGLLGDLETISSIARAGVRPAETRLEPGETRPCAILYLDIVGFTELSRSLSPDDLARLVDRTFRIFEVTVHGSGGYCDKVVGDAALYVFPGHPNHAPACQAALQCALGLRRRLEQVNQSLDALGLKLSIRAGVSFGVATRQQVGGGAQQLTVMGEVVNLAQRLESNAEPDTVSTTANVVAETELLFNFEPVGSVELKGFGPTEVFRLLAEKPREMRLRGGGTLSPLTGRARLISEAHGKAEEWLADPACPAAVLVFQGPTAVGKSRSALELLTQLRDQHPALRSCTVHCVPERGLLNLAADLCGIGGFSTGSTAQRWSELAALAADMPADQFEQFGQIVAYLLQDASVDTAVISRMDSASFLQACVLMLRTLFQAAASEHGAVTPLVVVVEDLQWSGRLAELLRPLLESAEGQHHLLVIGTARSAFNIDAGLETLLKPSGDGRGPQSAVFQVEPISTEDGAALLRLLLPGIELPVAVEEELHTKSLGLPYYYEEMARLLLRRGVVAPDHQDGGLHYRLTEPLRGLELPEDFRMLILGRMDLLEPGLRESAAHASVLGRSFTAADYADLESRLGGTPVDELAARLSGLCAQHVLVSGDGEHYFFEHILTHEAVYSSLLSGNRRALHGAAAEITALRLAPGTAAEWEVLPELCRHLEGAERYAEACEKCCDLLQLMARNQRFEGWEEKEQQFEKWLSTVTHPKLKETLNGLQEWARGLRFQQLAQPDEAGRALQSALQLIGKSDAKVETRILLDLGFLHFSLEDFSMAEGFFQAGRTLSRQIGSSDLEGETEYQLGRLYQRRGQIGKAIESYAVVLKLFNTPQAQHRLPALFNTLGSCYVDHEDTDSAIDCFTKARVRAKELGNRRTECAALGNLGVAWRNKGELEQALDAYQEALAETRSMSWKQGEAYNLMNIGDLLLEQGKLPEARQTLLNACDANRQIGAEWANGITHGTLGEVHIKLGELDLAAAALEEAERYLKARGDSFRRGLIQCSWVRFFLAVNNVAEAQAALARAKALSLVAGPEKTSALNQAIERAQEQLEAASP